MLDWKKRRRKSATAPKPRRASFRPGLEALEDRSLLSVTIGSITDATLPSGGPLFVPVAGTNSVAGDTVNYTATSSDPNVTVKVRNNEPYLQLNFKTYGTMVLQLFPDVAPVTVENIEALVREGFYTNLTIHRIVAGFVIQGGDPEGNGMGGPGFTFQTEIGPLTNYNGTGQLAMANSNTATDKSTNGSQFFITLAPNTTTLPGNYTLFGQLVEGFNVLNEIAALPVGGTNGDTPTNPPVILSAQLVSAPTDTVLLVQAPTGYNGDPLITVTGTDGSSSATQTFHVQVGTGGAALTNIQFVNRIYGDILNRVPEQSTLVSLTNALSSGAITPQQLVYSVQTSQESRIDQVTNIYSTLLNRKPTSQEFSTGVTFLNAGGSLSTLEAKVISTEEYFDDQGGTNAAWITGVYAQATGDSNLAPSYISYVSNELNTGLSMNSFAQSVFDSTGGAIHKVQSLFTTFLSRTPASNDPSIQGLVTALMDGVSEDLLIVTIATSPEFFLKL